MMAENRGGYRKPNNPASVSGPGKFSKRTDGGPMDTQPQRYMQGQAYGESKELNELQASAPLAGAPSRNIPSAPGAGRTPAPMPTPFGAATERPEEPITAGAPFGEGRNTLDLPVTQANVQDKEKLYVMLQILDRAAAQPGASLATQNLLRRLRGIL
jgi:hypothetical protein